LPVASAIQVNVVLSDTAASDDSDLRNIVHAGTPLTAAALAFAEREGSDGETVLTAIVLGHEAAGRISEAMTPGFKDRGFHGCFGAAFGSAVASARMLKLDAECMAQTIALTAVSIGGLATAADTSVSREYHAGLAAMHGTNAALHDEATLVRHGFWKRVAGSLRHSEASPARPQVNLPPAIWVPVGIS
jgi:2-methylcitrate dehydratase PrpD